jgi:hypothetical protein
MYRHWYSVPHAVGGDLAGNGAAGPPGQDSYVGSSNFAAWDVALAQFAASARDFIAQSCRLHHDRRSDDDRGAAG